jgi:hypothetical protein
MSGLRSLNQLSVGSAYHSDGGGGGAGDDSFVALGILGADGRRNYGWFDHRNRSDFAVFTGIVCSLVPR